MNSPTRTGIRLPRLRWLLAAALGLAALPALAQQSLTGISYVPIEGNGVLLTLSLDGAAPQPGVFTIDQPARLSLDFPGTRLAVAERSQTLNIGRIRRVSAAEGGGRTRVVVDMAQLEPYEIRVVGDQVQVRIGGSAASAAPPLAAGAASSPVVVAARSLTAVDFRRGERGEGRVVVTLSDPRMPVDVKEESGRIVLRFPGASVPDDLKKRMDVLDFATPVKFIDTMSVSGGAQLAITPSSGTDYEQAAYQTGDQYIVELQPLTPAEQAEKQRLEPTYTGERITLSFQSVDVRALLQIIADVAGTNMVVSDSVQGEIAMRLQNVPWDQALDIILRSRGLDKRVQGNVTIVAPVAELAERDRVALETQKQQVELAPLRSELMQVNYAKAADVAALLTDSKNSLLSERGRVTVDARTNTLLLLDTVERLGAVRSLIAQLDIPVKQVLIESRIVVANDDYSRELGTRFGVTTVGTNGDNGLVTTSGSGEATDGTIGSYLDNGSNFPVDIGQLEDRYNVSLPASNTAGRISLALLGSDYLVDLELSALQAEGRGEVVSSPRVVAANASEASIEQGVEIPYQEASSSGATSIEFKKAVLALKVTPQITPDNRIIMDLQVNNDTVGEEVANVFGGTVPSIDTREVITQVLVDNGQTVVLGGIYQQENRNSISKVPLLGDIPILGALFRNKLVVNNKDELLVFVTPKILDESLRLR